MREDLKSMREFLKSMREFFKVNARSFKVNARSFKVSVRIDWQAHRSKSVVSQGIGESLAYLWRVHGVPMAYLSRIHGVPNSWQWQHQLCDSFVSSV